MKFLRSFHPYAMVTILFWSLAYVLTRLVLQYVTAYSLGFLRYAVASLVLAVVCLFQSMRRVEKRDIWLFLLSGICGFFLYMITFNVGASTVTAATSSVVIASAPVFTALLASIFFGERLVPRQWAAIGIEFAGILILTLYGAIFSLNMGTVWLALAAMLLSCYNLLQRKLTRSYTALQSTAYSIFIGTILLACFAPRAVVELRTAPMEPLFYIVVLGVFSSAIAYLLWSKALERAPRTSLVSNYMFFTPFLTALLGFLLAGEMPEAYTWAGGGLILLGSLIFNFGGLLEKNQK